jgi:hypothetical protein
MAALATPAPRRVRPKPCGRIGLRSAIAAVACVVAMAACSTVPPSPETSVTPIVIISPERTSGPYVVVAVNYHFHDIHPQDHKKISEDRPFIVKNETDNLHNFSVAGTRISVDVRPNGEMAWSRLGDHLKPGFYQVFCKYHADRGMSGAFTVVP